MWWWLRTCAGVIASIENGSGDTLFLAIPITKYEHNTVKLDLKAGEVKLCFKALHPIQTHTSTLNGDGGIGGLTCFGVGPWGWGVC